MDGWHVDLTRCPLCPDVEMVDHPVPGAFSVAGAEFATTLPGRKCPRCGESFFEGRFMHGFELLVAARVAVSTARSAEAIDLMAASTFLEAAELSRLLGVDEATLGDYRAGRREIEPSVRALLAVLVLEKVEGAGDVVERLRRLAARAELVGGRVEMGQ